MAPAHPHATSVAVYPALFKEKAIYLALRQPTILKHLHYHGLALRIQEQFHFSHFDF